jgi:A/G-specific adenine glycosylase
MTMAVRRNLLRWYDRHRRDLPWRDSRDPYRIWVSEVMLQQTRVQAVLPYYDKFLRLFPDVVALAAADEQTLLACWSGLGYYSRARNLRDAARKITREYGGEFPREYVQARQLPGVGDYTARAVLSIAYGVPLAVVDGNVARVLSRLYALQEDFRRGPGREKFVRLADALLAPRRAGDFNQAMMELGATVCLPGQPRCPTCPLRGVCLARERNAVDRFPPARRPSKPTMRRFIATVICDTAGRCLLVRRPKSAKRLAGFWELPMWELSHPVPPSLPSAKLPSAAPLGLARDKLGTGRAWDWHPIPRDGVILEKFLGRVRHTITSNVLEIRVHAARLERKAMPAGSRWVPPQEMDRLPVTTITRKALACVGLESADCAD